MGCDGVGKIMCYKLHEDVYGKVETLAESKKSYINLKSLDKELIMAYTTMGLVCQVIKSRKRMPAKKSESCNKLMAGMCQMVRVGLLTAIWIHDGIQIFVIDVGFGLNDFIELPLIEMYSKCCEFVCASFIFKKVSEPVFTSLDAVSIIVPLRN